ncbi:hypothetical protein ABZU94_36000 [Streptomyces mirabilis]
MTNRPGRSGDMLRLGVSFGGPVNTSLWSRRAKRSTTLLPPRSKTRSKARTATDFRDSRP